MAAVLVVAACLSVLLAVALNGFLLWLSCKICRVARPAAAPGGKLRGVGYLRAVLCAFGLALVGGATGAAFSFILPNPFSSSASPTLQAIVFYFGAELLFGLALNVLILRFTLPTSLAKAFLVMLLCDAFSVVAAVGLFFGIRAGMCEAFVLPSGSMAETALGYHKEIICPQCGYRFPVNSSQEADPQDAQRDASGRIVNQERVIGCTCPNCRLHIAFASSAAANLRADEVPEPANDGGDRVMVGKGLFGPSLAPPQRMDLLVFEYPVNPSDPRAPAAPMNYLKRLIGLPGETIAIHNGDLYILPGDKGPKYDDLKDSTDPVKPENLWQKRHMHVNDEEALKQFGNGEFEIVRKRADLVLTMKRLVYDNDHPAKDLLDVQPPRWADRTADPGAWAGDGKNGFKLAPASDDRVHWLGYRHLLRDSQLEETAVRQLAEQLKREPTADELHKRLGERYGDEKPRLITDFMGYNTWEGQNSRHGAPGENWVGDLILEGEVQIDQPQGELTLELSKGVDRFRARWDLATGFCTLLRVQGDKEESVDTKPTGLKGGGSHRVRFANVDQRLTVWVDDALPFGDGVSYEPAKTAGPAPENDLEPASIGLKGSSATVHSLKLWRDVYYTTANRGNPGAPDVDRVDPSDPSTWSGMMKPPVMTCYVQPACFFVLGDNSQESSDSRSWGLVPKRLLLGKAFLVYYPLDRAGWIR